MMSLDYSQLEQSDGESDAASHEDLVSVPRAELESLRAAARRAAAPVDSDPTGVEAGARLAEDRFDRELAERERKALEWERAFKATLKEKELATALSGRPLVPGAASQLVKLWRDELEVVDESGRFRVLTRDGRTVDEAVSAWLAGAEYAHFSRPGSRGGTTQPGELRSAVVPAAIPAAPRNMGEAALLRWKEALDAVPGPPAGPIGLGRRRI